ncbi:MAG: hypothetical protein GX653_02180, partial [Clostridiales bacterium]|nr:hypothetical protein [Clostridiales bacterium]
MMKHAVNKNPIQRAAALALALLMLLGPLVSLAEPQPPIDPVSFTLSWTGADGTPKTQQALLVPYAEYPNSYWLYADAEAVAQNALLHISDNFGQYPGGFSIPNDQPIGNLMRPDAGTAPAPENAVPVQAFDQSGNVLMTYTLFVSGQTDQPLPPTVLPTEVPVETPTDAPIQDAPVRIWYKNVDGTQDVATPQERTYPAGTHAVNPEPADLNPAFDPSSVAPQQVTVDQNGASPAEFTFYYQPYPINDATVRIYYKNADG